MPRIICVFALWLVLFSQGFAQAPDTLWSRTFGGPLHDYGFCIQALPDGGFAIAGFLDDTFTNPESNGCLIRTDSNGVLIWEQVFGGEGADEIYSVEPTVDGGFILAGWTESYGSGDKDAWLLKTDPDGTLDWSQLYGGTEDDIFNYAIPTMDSGYILVGYTNSSAAGAEDILIIKTDSEGQEEWTNVFGGPHRDEAKHVQQTVDGGYIVTGWSCSEETGILNVFLLKMDTDGQSEWTTAYDDDDNVAIGNYIQQTSDGGYIVVGDTWVSNFEVFIMKTDSDGNIRWNNLYGAELFDLGNCIRETPDGGYIIAGSYSINNETDMDLWLLKIDADGEEVWSRIVTGNRNERAESFDFTPDGGIIAAGYTESFGPGDNDIWLVRFGADISRTDEFISTIPQFVVIGDIYPNPFNSSTSVTIGLPAPSFLSIRVYNLLGQEICVVMNTEFPAGQHRFPFHANDLASGVYFIQATVPGGWSSVQKVQLLR